MKRKIKLIKRYSIFVLIYCLVCLALVHFDIANLLISVGFMLILYFGALSDFFIDLTRYLNNQKNEFKSTVNILNSEIEMESVLMYNNPENLSFKDINNKVLYLTSTALYYKANSNINKRVEILRGYDVNSVTKDEWIYNFCN